MCVRECVSVKIVYRIFHISRRKCQRKDEKYTQAFTTMSRRKLAIFVIVYIMNFFLTLFHHKILLSINVHAHQGVATKCSRFFFCSIFSSGTGKNWLENDNVLNLAFFFWLFRMHKKENSSQNSQNFIYKNVQCGVRARGRRL